MRARLYILEMYPFDLHYMSLGQDLCVYNARNAIKGKAQKTTINKLFLKEEFCFHVFLCYSNGGRKEGVLFGPTNWYSNLKGHLPFHHNLSSISHFHVLNVPGIQQNSNQRANKSKSVC